MKPLLGLDIMPVGDSITFGFGAADVVANGAWRFYLGQLLVSYLKGQPNWIGDNIANGVGIAGNRMLGASGQRVDNLLSSTYDAAGQFLRWQPDVCFIHIGTNDVTQSISGFWVGGSIPLSITNLSTLLDNIRTARASTVVIIAKIIPNTDATNDAGMTTWNSQMETMVNARSDKDFIFIADCNAAFKANPSWATDYMNDATHPNGAGEQVIANTFFSTFTSNVTVMPRTTANPRQRIIPDSFSLSYNASTATDLGSSVFLNTTQPFAVEWTADASLTKTQAAFLGTFWELKTDQSNGFKALYNGPSRGIDFGGPTDFGRWFCTGVNVNYAIMSYGWHHYVITFDGVDRTATSSYKFYIDGVNRVIASGSGLAGTGNVNTLGIANASQAGIFSMSRFRVWNGGTAMTAAQVAALYQGNILPSGPTLTHAYLHTEGSGTTLTDSVGGANGTIGTATWSSNVPTKLRTTAAARTQAAARTLAS